ncbi:transcriptional regulator [Burkholderia cenocepacia]|uniref:transcriptional regulator n=1 Tax=Burkholderia cenocepacia TaxID=95486 RepID=UPI002011360D|nr:transcriptional regulator [Burkholderia cenocepacia]
MPNDNVLTELERLRNGLENCIENARLRNDAYDVGYMNSMLTTLNGVIAAHPGQPGIACVGGHGIAGLGRMTNDDDGFVRLQFVSEAAADAFMEAYGPTVDISEMPEPRAEVTEEQPSLTNPLTPYGMLVRAPRIVTGTLLGDMAKALVTTPAKLSAMEFGRAPVTLDFALDVAAYFDALGVPDTLVAIRRAIDAARTGASS